MTRKQLNLYCPACDYVFPSADGTVHACNQCGHDYCVQPVKDWDEPSPLVSGGILLLAFLGGCSMVYAIFVAATAVARWVS